MCSHYWVMLFADTISRAVFHYDLWKDKNLIKAVIAGVLVTIAVHLLGVGMAALCKKHPRLTRVAQIIGVPV